ncbi:MAG: haloalkane dehalogenase [Methanocella sp. PtaU1.Bin125]|nr:MAG: haloalkane dehalogenase [Methanocella sp. PtaU1.Bin125]
MVAYYKMKVDDLDIFHREAGSKDSPALVLLHGFPASSHMFRNLMPALADQFYLIAPDYPGFGNSAMPSVDEFEYSFDHLAEVVDKFLQAKGLEKFSLYLFDYGAPIGFRLAHKHPEKIESLIIQNGNAYDEGLREFWDPLKAFWQDRSPANEAALRKFLTPEATKWQYTNGVRHPEAISPDGWNMDAFFLNRPGNDRIQLELFYSYGTNPPLYPQWQAYFREYQPATLIVWGKNDAIFPAEGAHPYRRDLKDVDFNLLDTGHFALEDHCREIAGHIRGFFARRAMATTEAGKAEAR